MKSVMCKWNIARLILVVWFLVCAQVLSAQTPPAPLAEIYFSSYNPSMFQKKNAEGKSLKELLDDPNIRSSPFFTRSESLQEDREKRGFCFISIGCWGGPSPQSERQTIVRDHLVSYIENGILLSPSGLQNVPMENVNRYPVHFVLAAGDNFYPRGVDSPESISFYTTFESFYRRNAVTPYFSSFRPIEKNEVEATLFTPWIVALGNHDAIKNSEAQVQYTYESVDNHAKLSSLWKDSQRHKQEKDDQNYRPTGRWYMPHNYYSLMVSDDTLVVVLDVPQLHRCSVYRSTQQNTENVSMEDADGRNKNIKATALDCHLAENQQKDVKNWLLEEYAQVPFKIVMGHYPMKGNGPHSNYPFLVDWLQPLLNQSCAVLYIHADNHYLQVSHDGLQYYANSGGGAGNDGKLHFPMERKSWHHPASVFQSIQGGFMIHCKLQSNEDDSDQRFLNYVIGEDGTEQFSFRIDISELQTCRRRHHLPNRTAPRQSAKRHYIRIMFRIVLGSVLVLFGLRCGLGRHRTLVNKGRVNYLISKVLPRRHEKRRAWPLSDDTFSNSAIEDPVYVITSPSYGESKEETVRIRLVEMIIGVSLTCLGLGVMLWV